MNGKKSKGGTFEEENERTVCGTVPKEHQCP